MGFILGVLIFSALISVIFGKRIGALFATGVLGVAAVGVGLCSIAFLWFLVANGFWSTPTPSSSSASSYGSTPAYRSSAPSQTYAPAAPTPGPTYQASSSAPATGTGPRLGVDVADVPVYTVQQLAYLHVPAGAGTWISVQPNSPAENAGLKTYDVILSAGTQSQPADWITPTNQLPNYLDQVGYNVPVRLHVYRATEQRDFWVWAYPR